MSISFRKKFFKNKSLGQSTAEYLIILILVSISSIGVMSLFGKSVRQQLTKVVAAFTGDTTTFSKVDTKSTSAEAEKRAAKNLSMKGIDVKELSDSKGRR